MAADDFDVVVFKVLSYLYQCIKAGVEPFWRSVDLTGNQTRAIEDYPEIWFWRSVDLTGNQTVLETQEAPGGFGAVLI